MFRNKSNDNQSNIGIEALLSESRRILDESKTKDLSVVAPTGNVSPEIREIMDNLSIAIQRYQDRMQYDIMKYQLANKALHTGLWDMEVIDGDPVNPNNTFIWSDEFRQMLGFTDENDFPNKLNSWSDRIHPEDKERTLNAFAAHLTDYSGKTPYNLEYRLLLKNGEYGYFQALGDTVRDDTGKPLRVAGLLRDIAEEKAKELNKQLMERIGHASGIIDGISKMVHELNAGIDEEETAVNESSAVTEKIVNSLKHTSEISRKEQETIQGLIEIAAQGQESMRETIESVHDISQSVDGIGNAIQIISAIAANTNLLSMNAAIEAAHAGEAGRGFAVVANEIRRLADNTRANSRNISLTLKSIIEGIAFATKQSGDTENRITEISREINGFAQTMTALINTFNELAMGSNEIITALDILKKQSTMVKTGYAEMLSMTDTLRNSMHELKALAENK
jgi:PAS domain-containing protein/uncharacterized coiled-coil DUF342 family protein